MGDFSVDIIIIELVLTIEVLRRWVAGYCVRLQVGMPSN